MSHQQQRKRNFLTDMKRAISNLNPDQIKQIHKEYFPYFYQYDDETMLMHALIEYRDLWADPSITGAQDDALRVILELIKISPDINELHIANISVVSLLLRIFMTDNDLLKCLRLLRKRGYDFNRIYNDKTDLIIYLFTLDRNLFQHRVFNQGIFNILSGNFDRNILRQSRQLFLNILAQLPYDANHAVFKLYKDHNVKIFEGIDQRRFWNDFIYRDRYLVRGHAEFKALVKLYIDSGLVLDHNALLSIFHTRDVYPDVVKLITRHREFSKHELVQSLQALLMNRSVDMDKVLEITKHLVSSNPEIVNHETIRTWLVGAVRYGNNLPLIMWFLPHMKDNKRMCGILLESGTPIAQQNKNFVQDFCERLEMIQSVKRKRQLSQRNIRSVKSFVQKDPTIMGSASRMPKQLFTQLQSYIIKN
jgi:hypothetical protein